MLEEKVKFVARMLGINSKPIFQNTARIAGMLYSLATVILAFTSWDDLGITDLNKRILILLEIGVASFFIGLTYTILFQRSRCLWRCGNRSITVRYQNMLKLAFSRIRTGEKLMVIPVNTGFDTIVDHDPTQEDPLVSPESLHGQWIMRMNRDGVAVEELDQRIKEYLDANYPGAAETVMKKRGNQFSYPYGTTVILHHRNTTFLLLAISKFDKHNVADSNLTDYRKCLITIIKHCHNKGQGYDLYIPLMGTKMSGLQLSHEGALKMVTSALIFYNDRLRGKVNVVIYPGERDAVTIFDA